MFTVRPAIAADSNKIYALYKAVATLPVGIARSAAEISEAYIAGFMEKAAATGIQLVIEDPENSDVLAAEIHCYKLAPKTFDHVLSELTIAVHPHFQSKGLGKMIFAHLLELVKNSRPDILRVELVAQESNTRAIELYKKLGFVIEGRFEKRIRNTSGGYEADVPMGWVR